MGCGEVHDGEVAAKNGGNTLWAKQTPDVQLSNATRRRELHSVAHGDVAPASVLLGEEERAGIVQHLDLIALPLHHPHVVGVYGLGAKVDPEELQDLARLVGRGERSPDEPERVRDARVRADDLHERFIEPDLARAERDL